MELLAFLSIAAFWTAFIAAGIGYLRPQKRRTASRIGWAGFCLGLSIFLLWGILRAVNSM